MGEVNFEMPRRDDRLTRGDVPDWQYNAVLGPLWSDISGWNAYVNGYKDGADLIVASVVGGTTTGMSDWIAFPVVFLYRHHFELALKTIIVVSSRLYDEEIAPFHHHRLVDLWHRARVLIERHWPEGDPEVYETVGRLIEELDSLDPNSMSFRYPETRNGDPTIPSTTYVNLRNLADVAGRLSNFLTGSIIGLWVDLEQKETFLSDMRSMFGDEVW